MSHKADKSFFKTKRDWSKSKDLILGDYLVPYFAKIATLQRPVLVVDGFAGPGRFEDGEIGSPLIICQAIERSQAIREKCRLHALLIERDPVLARKLRVHTEQYRSFVEVRESSFEGELAEIVQMSRSHNIFLYLDPFTVKGLSWTGLDDLFQQLSRSTSIEVLINFNVTALGRAACVALDKKFDRILDRASEFADESSSTIKTIDSVLGSDWWQSPFRSAMTFPEACQGIVDGYLQRLGQRFSQVCHYAVKERHSHSVPKYLLVFGSRHPDALELMNDCMAKSLKVQAEREQADQLPLFETRPITLVPDQSELPGLILRMVQQPIKRGYVIQQIIRVRFGLYLSKEIRGQIEALLKSGKVQSETGKVRINNDISIWKRP